MPRKSKLDQQIEESLSGTEKIKSAIDKLIENCTVQQLVELDEHIVHRMMEKKTQDIKLGQQLTILVARKKVKCRVYALAEDGILVRREDGEKFGPHTTKRISFEDIVEGE